MPLLPSIFAALPPLLAQEEDDGEIWMKLIPFGMFIAIFAFGLLASILKRKNAAEPQMQKNIARFPAMRAKTAKKMVVQQRQKRMTPPPFRGRPTAPAAHLMPSVPRAAAAPAPPPLPGRPPATQPAGGGRGMNASTLRRWLKPAVMRQQFVLTELFDPPPSVR